MLSLTETCICSSPLPAVASCLASCRFLYMIECNVGRRAFSTQSPPQQWRPIEDILKLIQESVRLVILRKNSLFPLFLLDIISY